MSEKMPEPEEVRHLMTRMGAEVVRLVEVLASHAKAYGIHGDPSTWNGVTFQLTRVGEKWSVFVTTPEVPGPRDLLGVRLDEKLVFLKHQKEFLDSYASRVRTFYEDMKAVVGAEK